MIEEVGVLAVLLPQQTHGELAHGEHRVRLQRDEGRETRHRVDQTLPQHHLRQVQRLEPNGRLGVGAKLHDERPVPLRDAVRQAVIVLAVDRLETLTLLAGGIARLRALGISLPAPLRAR